VVVLHVVLDVEGLEIGHVLRTGRPLEAVGANQTVCAGETVDTGGDAGGTVELM
jgi:hypothetical protein